MSWGRLSNIFPHAVQRGTSWTSIQQKTLVLLHAIHSLFYWRILQKPYSSLVLKILTKTKIRETRKLEYIDEYHFVQRKNERKPDKNLRLTRFKFMPRNLDQKCHIRIPCHGENKFHKSDVCMYVMTTSPAVFLTTTRWGHRWPSSNPRPVAPANSQPLRGQVRIKWTQSNTVKFLRV